LQKLGVCWSERFKKLKRSSISQPTNITSVEIACCDDCGFSWSNFYNVAGRWQVIGCF